MSRTYRRKRGDFYYLYHWELTDYQYINGIFNKFKIDPKSPEGLRRIARFHSDAYRSFKEPGPSWFRTQFVQAPYRRHANNELRKASLDLEYEVMLESMPYLVYWT